MPVTLLSTPYKSIGSDVCLWVAINNDVFFKLQRGDFVVTGTANSSGDTALVIAGGGVPSLTVGDQVYIILNNGSRGYYEIISSTATDIVINLPWSSNTTGVVNLTDNYTQYKVFVTYQYTDNGGASWNTHQENVYYQMSPDHSCLVNISPFLKSLVKITPKAITPSVVNDIADDISRWCRVQITEEYFNGTTTISQEAIDEQYVNIVDAVAQRPFSDPLRQKTSFGIPNGVNLVKNISNDNADAILEFMRDFKEPTLFVGFPFHLTFLYSELMLPIVNVRDSVNADATLSTDGVGFVNRLYPNGNYTTAETFTIVLKEAAVNKIFSEVLTCRFRNCTIQNPVCLKWMGRSGAWNFYVFGHSQVESTGVKTQGEFAQFNEDISTADTDSDVLTKEEAPEIIVGGSLFDLNDINGLRSLLSSPKIMMLTNPDTWSSAGDEWITVKVSDGKYKITDTRAAVNEFECTLRLPQLINQTN